MQGASRDSLATLRERLDDSGALGGGAGAEPAAGLGGELLSVASLLGRERGLRGQLADPGAPAEAKAGLVHALLDSRLSPLAVGLVDDAVRSRWSAARDLPDALETIGTEVVFARAEHAGDLDRVEDELFRIARAIEASPDLRRLVDDPHGDVQRKREVMHDILEGRAHPTTVEVLDHVVGSPRGRHVDAALSDLVELAARRRDEVIAQVQLAVAPTAEQEQRLAATLGGVYGRTVKLQVQVDPTVLGGGRVVVGDEVIDGTVVRRLEQARRRLVG